MAKPKTKTVVRTRTKIVNKIKRIKGKGDTVHAVMSDIGVGTTTALAVNALGRGKNIPKYVAPAVSAVTGGVLAKGSIGKRVLHATISAVTSYVADRVIKNEPIIPELNITSGQGTGLNGIVILG